MLRGLRKDADEYNAVLIGETYTSSIDELKHYYGDHSSELQLPMDMMFATVDKLTPAEFREPIASVNSSCGWPVFLIGNHDMPRSYNRYGDGVHDDAIAKVMAALYLTLRGSPILYYGEEIGMQNNDPKNKKDVTRKVRSPGPPRKAVTGNALPCSGLPMSTVASAQQNRGCPCLRARQLTMSPLSRLIPCRS